MPSRCSGFEYRHVRQMGAIAPPGLPVEDADGTTLTRGGRIHNLRKCSPLNIEDRAEDEDGLGEERRAAWSHRVAFSSQRQSDQDARLRPFI
jgi:hypothetical protein